VSIYNFRDAIEDGSTVPLYHENRIPELQLVNEDFSDELTALLEEAELDEETEGQLARRFGREYTLLTRPERLRTIARDLVRHFVGRGFTAKAMYVGVDKAAAVRMSGFSTPTSLPTRTRRRCSTPRSRRSSTTSPPPTATPATASTTEPPSSRPARPVGSTDGYEPITIGRSITGERGRDVCRRRGRQQEASIQLMYVTSTWL